MTEISSPTELIQRLDLPNTTRTEFITAMTQLYRGELTEATAWRSRIDTTSHWAIVLSATALSFVFSDPGSERQVLIPIITLFTTFLMVMEARRYRFLDIWRSRARLLEINFYRPLLDGRVATMPGWTETLAHDMEWPHFHMPWWEAVGRRLRRNYQWIYAILLGSWLVVLSSHPTSVSSFSEMVDRAAIGPISGGLVFASMVVFYSGLVVLGLYSIYASRIRKSLPAGHPGRLSTAHSDDA